MTRKAAPLLSKTAQMSLPFFHDVLAFGIGRADEIGNSAKPVLGLAGSRIYRRADVGDFACSGLEVHPPASLAEPQQA